MKPLSFEYSVRKSKRAKRVLIHVELDGSVEVVLPWRVAKWRADAFVRQRQDWIEAMRAKNVARQEAVPQRRFVTGELLPFFGDAYELVVQLEPGRKRAFMKEDGMRFVVRARDEAQVRERVLKWYKVAARDYFVGEAIAMAKLVGRQVSAVKVLNTKSQWGSCNRRTGVLTFQWRLALAPVEVARYVVAHEVAHLVQANHSADFWAVVGELFVDYKAQKEWLKVHGHELQL